MRRASSGLILILASWIAGRADSSIPRSSSGSGASTPRSPSTSNSVHAHTDNDDLSYYQRPAWNASPKINQQGYLCELFRRIPGEWESSAEAASISDQSHHNNLNTPVIIRQVPGDGCCLFHAVAISLNLIRDGIHLRMDTAESLRELKAMSRSLRHVAVDCLRSCGVEQQRIGKSRSLFFRRTGRISPHAIVNSTATSTHHHERSTRKYPRLFIQGTESMSTSQLLSTAASQYGITPEEYCDLMEQDSYWGGGPEIVALCNVLKRPIHVFELVPWNAVMNSAGDDDDTSTTTSTTTIPCAVRVPDHLINQQFCLRRMATFGSPKYDSKMPLHILSADSRFPDVNPESIFENGNHFMALFPVDIMSKWASTEEKNDSMDNSDRKQRIRGGGGSAVLMPSDEEVEENNWLCNNRKWYNYFNYSVGRGEPIEWNCQQQSWYQTMISQRLKTFQEKMMKFGITHYDRTLNRVSSKPTVTF
ncbi:hypothetical protein ACHAWU_007222 [Discostella pseudostelligera]|uniref:Ubiquitin thioesterase OTU n=1 Tax=Discostella pseudostelligera TaxID=259834 RepID=A0ABD3LX18_9STRA